MRAGLSERSEDGLTNDALLHQPVLAWARSAPAAAAVVTRDGTVSSYGELATASAAVAAWLRSTGVAPGDRVGVWMPKSAAAVGALLGILRAGGVYVPLDWAAPEARIAALAADAGLKAALVAPSQAAAAGAWAPEVLASGPCLAELAAAAGVRSGAGPLPEVARRSHECAYILYTSGSTGKPKGVMLSHRHALGFARWAAGEVTLGPGDRVASHAPFHFDLSIFDLWSTLGSGAAVCLLDATTARFPRALADWIVARQLTHWYAVPSALVQLLSERARVAAGSRLRHVCFAGEVFPPPALDAWRRALPQAGFHNWYGPTETNVCTYFRLPPIAADPRPAPDPLPIGQACPGFRLRVGDEKARALQAGEPGYLWAQGEGVMLGYWGDGARTAQVMRADEDGGGPWYNTGDVVAATAAGNEVRYVFCGRRDHLIKCRGYRVSLLEVEQALGACRGVRRAVVVARPTPEAAVGLAAFVEPSGGAADELGCNPQQLRRDLALRLPTYMIPDPILLRAELPLTSSGKLDRQSLQREVAGLGEARAAESSQ